MIAEEDVRIEGIDIDGAPPCEVRVTVDDDPCGAPSTCRLCADCPDCGRIFSFSCTPCYRLLLHRGAYCPKCVGDILLQVRMC